MTVDEAITQIEDGIRRLKIEFDIYFNGGSKRPPTDLHWKVESLIKRYGEGQRLTFPQRFRYNGLVSRYALFNDKWRQKVKAREEGREPRRREAPPREEVPAAFKTQWQDPEKEHQKVEQLFQALMEAKKKCGQGGDALPLENFKRFVKQKTEQLKKDQWCRSVEYVVEVEKGQVRLKAKGSS